VNRKPGTDQPEVAKVPATRPGQSLVPDNKESTVTTNDQQVVIAENPFSNNKTKSTVNPVTQPDLNPAVSKKQESRKMVSPVPGNPVPENRKEEAVAGTNPANQPSNNLPRPLNNPNLVNQQRPSDALAINIKENNLPERDKWDLNDVVNYVRSEGVKIKKLDNYFSNNKWDLLEI